MKTTLFLIATLFISTITFSQTTKKGYDHYAASNQSSAAKKMNKGELIDAMAKDGNISKRAARTGRNPQTGRDISSGRPTGKRGSIKTETTQGNQKAQARHNWMNNPSRATSSKQASGQSKDLHLRKRPGRSQGDPIPGIGITKEQGFAQDGDDLHIRKRPGRSKTVGNYTTINSGKKLRKRPGSTKYKSTLLNQQIDSLKATDYNSSRSNKSL